MDRFFSDSGIITNIVPYIVEYTYAGSYELVVAISYLNMLLKKFQNFKIFVDYNPFQLADEDICNYGIWEANRRARINIFDNAAEATRNRWGHKLAKCYRIAIYKAGFGTELKRTILNWDI